VARQIADDFADTFVVEDHRHVAWSSEQRQPVPQRQRLGVVHFQSIAVDHRYRERPERYPVSKRPYRIGECVSVHNIPRIYLLSAIVPAGL
jgi:hypothetical protein